MFISGVGERRRVWCLHSSVWGACLWDVHFCRLLGLTVEYLAHVESTFFRGLITLFLGFCQVVNRKLQPHSLIIALATFVKDKRNNSDNNQHDNDNSSYTAIALFINHFVNFSFTCWCFSDNCILCRLFGVFGCFGGTSKNVTTVLTVPILPCW